MHYREKLKELKGYTALIRRKDAEKHAEVISELLAADISIELIDESVVMDLFKAVTKEVTQRNFWPQGSVYMVPPTSGTSEYLTLMSENEEVEQ